MAKPLSFKIFSESIDAERLDANTGTEEHQEALDLKQRRARALSLRRNKAKIAMGRKRAERRVASMDKLKKRSRKTARNLILKKLLKDVPKVDLTPARKKEIEKKLEKPIYQNKIARSAKKLLPSVRKAEIEKKRGRK